MDTTSSLTQAVAIWGAITGTAGTLISLFGLYVSFLNYKRDRADVKLEFEKDRELIGPNLRGYKRNTSYLCLSVLNKGRRIVTIDSVSAVFLREQGRFIFSDSMIYGSRELKEGKRADFITEQNGIDFSDISYFQARDSIGNIYRKNYARWYRRFVYWFLDKSYIRRKPKVSEAKR